MPLEKLTRERIIEALNLLGRLAEREQLEIELCIYGGSALLLAFGSRLNTKDVDAVMRPASVARRLADTVAKDLGLDESWLNSEVRQFLSPLGTFAPLQIEELEAAAKHHLKITRPSASYLLAMKALACRSALPGYTADIDDLRFLIRKLNLKSIADVETHIDRFYPGDALTLPARGVIESILAEQSRP